MSTAQWLGGQRVTADRLQNMLNKFSDFTPVLSVPSGTAPTFGNATVTCRYARSGDLITAHYDIIWGSTSTFGGATDNWRIGLPVTAKATTQAIGTIFMVQTNGIRAAGRARLTTTAAFEIEIQSGRPDGTAVASTGIADASSPWTWASGNAFRGVIRYEAA